MEEVTNGKNRNYIMEKFYRLDDPDGCIQLNYDVMKLTMNNARLSVIARPEIIKVYVYCKMTDSVTYGICEELGFVEF